MHSLVKDLMTPQVVTIGPATPFKEIVARLADHRVSAVPVVDDDGLVLGVVSEADLLLKEEFPDPDADIPLFWTKRRRLERDRAAATTARDLMSIAVVSIAPDATVAEAARRMLPGGAHQRFTSPIHRVLPSNRYWSDTECAGFMTPTRSLLPGRMVTTPTSATPTA